MGGMKNIWLNMLDDAKRKGRADATNHEALPTDDQLWAYARTLEGGQLLAVQPDAELLEELREAYDRGRQPSRVDLWAVTREIKAAGHYAFVDHTGGNTATLYAGRPVPDEDRVFCWSAWGGPGWFEGAGWTKPFADTSEFGIGQHDDAAQDAPEPVVPEHTTPAEVAKLIVGVIEAAEIRRTTVGVTYATRDAVAHVYGEHLADELERVYADSARNASEGAQAGAGNAPRMLRVGESYDPSDLGI